MAAVAGFLHDPAFGLGIQIRQIAEFLERQEVALEVFDAGFDDALLLRVVRRTGIDAKPIAASGIGVGALGFGVMDTCLGDGAFGVVDD
jgi:hypothetical protein